MKKITIIGSNAFVATYLIAALADGKNRVRLFGKTPPYMLPDGFEFCPFQLPGQPIDFETLLDEDLIVVTAAAGAQVGGRYDAQQTFAMNAFFPIQLLNFLNGRPDFKGAVVTFGSYFEIGANQSERPFSELQVVAAIGEVPNDYCSSKRLLSRFIANRPLSVRHYHLFVTNIYGKGENANRLIPYLIENLTKNQPVKLTSGLQIRQYLHVEDLVGVLCDILENDYPSGIYNISRPEAVQVRDVVKTVFGLLGKPIFDEMFGQAGRADEAMQVLLLDGKKMETTFRFQPKTSIREGILTYL